MHLTLPAILSPKLLKPQANVASPVHAKGTEFAALLESIHADVRGIPQEAINKKESASSKETSRPQETAAQSKKYPQPPAPKKTKDEGRTLHVEPNDLPQQKAEEDSVQGTALAIVPPAPPQKQDLAPLAFGLPLPIAIQNAVESSSLTAPAPERVPEQDTNPPQSESSLDSQPAVLPRLQFNPPTINPPAPSATTFAHVQTKMKAPAAQTAEPLTAFRLPLEEAHQKASPSQIAFEAKLTPTQPKPDSASPVPAPAPAPNSQPAAQQEVRTANTAPTPETKPDRSGEAAISNLRAATPAHAIESAVKILTETPAFTAPSSHLEKPATGERVPEPAKPALPPAAELPDIPAPRTEPARDISFRIASTPTDAVDVKLVDRAGQIHVAVRSSDPVLTQSLQSNITELAGKLDKAGFQAETLVPNHAQPLQQPQQTNSFQQSFQDRRAPQQEFQQRKKRPAESNVVFTLNPQQEKS